MDIMQAIAARHSVRKYSDEPIGAAAVDRLRRVIDRCNVEGGLRFQLCLEHPDPFASHLATYGMFEGVRNYVALVGEKARRSKNGSATTASSWPSKRRWRGSIPAGSR